MSEELDALRAEVRALRAEVAAERTEAARAVTRRRLLTGLAGVGAAAVVPTSSAAAADGEPVLLGESNTSTSPTELVTEFGNGIHRTLRVVLDDPEDPVVSLDSANNPAILAESVYTGVVGSGRFIGAIGVSDTGIGVLAYSTAEGGLGLLARTDVGPGPAAELDSADGVAVRFTPAAATGAPTGTHTYYEGSLSIDAAGDPWLCTAQGAPGTWTRLLREDTAAGRVIPITPTRMLDTRATGGRPSGSPAVPGQKKGPLQGGQPLTLDLAGVAPIPATASGVIGNLTITGPTQAGYLAAMPSGGSNTTSSLNFGRNATIANAFTSRLGPDGLTLIAFGAGPMTYQLIVDITAYIT